MGRKNWEERKVNAILTNKIYIGTLEWGKSRRKKEDILIIENHSPAIIEKDLFEMCQFKRNQNSHGNYGKQHHIFHRVIKCNECSSTMHCYYSVKTKSKKKVMLFFVRCKNPTCTLYNKNYNTKKIEEDFVRILKGINQTDILKIEKLRVPYVEHQAEINLLEQELLKLNKQEKKLLELSMRTEMSYELINEKLAIIRSERQTLILKQAKLSDTSFSKNEEIDIEKLFNQRRLRGLDNVDILWQLLNRESKSKVVTSMIEEMYIERDKNYNISITQIKFRNEFLQNRLITLDEFLESKLAVEYQGKELVKKLKMDDLQKIIIMEQEQCINFNYAMNLDPAKRLQLLNDKIKEHELGYFFTVGKDDLFMSGEITF